jgi:undecaprenyl-diphosphatase
MNSFQPRNPSFARRVRASRRGPRVVRPSRDSVPPDLAIATLAAAVFTALGIAAHHDLLAEINQRARALVRARDARTIRVARTITLLSESGVHPILGWLASKGASRVVGRTHVPFAASLAVFVLNKGTRLFVHQARPPGAKPRHGLDRLGYPSGHTLAATAIAFATALEIAEGRPIGQRSALFAAAAGYAATIGWTRLTLDEHWIDDVVGAWAGGIALAIVVRRLRSARLSG